MTWKQFLILWLVGLSILWSVAALRHVARTGSIIISGQQVNLLQKVKLIGGANCAEVKR